MKWHWWLLLLFTSCSLARGGEFDFKNLGFDDAKTGALRPDSGEFGPAADLLPGWTVQFGDTIESQVGYNVASDLPHFASVWGKDFPYLHVPSEFAFYIITRDASAGTPSLSQLGQIPAGANYLAFTYFGYYPEVTVNGQQLKHVAPIPFYWYINNPMEMYLDVSEYAGKLAQLRFAIPAVRQSVGGDLFLDNIHFTNVIPEPGTATLFALGGALIAFSLWSRRWPRAVGGE